MKHIKTLYLLMGPSCESKAEFLNKATHYQNVTIIPKQKTLREQILKLKRVLPKKFIYTQIIYFEHPLFTWQARKQIYKAIKQMAIPCEIIALLFNNNKEYQHIYPYELSPSSIYIMGGNNDILANRSNNVKPSSSINMGNMHNSIHFKCDQLDQLHIPKEKITPYIRLLSRIRIALQ